MYFFPVLETNSTPSGTELPSAVTTTILKISEPESFTISPLGVFLSNFILTLTFFGNLSNKFSPALILTSASFAIFSIEPVIWFNLISSNKVFLILSFSCNSSLYFSKVFTVTSLKNFFTLKSAFNKLSIVATSSFP